jgi:hypothetical protein
MRLFHTTQSAERILAEGFRDVLGPFEFVHRTQYGVFVASSPAYVDEDPRDARCWRSRCPTTYISTSTRSSRPDARSPSAPAHASAPARMRLFSHAGSL